MATLSLCQLRHRYEAASVPPSPCAGLSEKQIKRLEKGVQKDRLQDRVCQGTSRYDWFRPVEGGGYQVGGKVDRPDTRGENVFRSYGSGFW